MKLDTIALVETPEGIDLQSEVVGLVPRALAYTVDMLIRIAIMFVISIVAAATGEAGGGILLIVYFVLEWWYAVLFEVFKNGQTPGKKSFNIKVVNEDLTPVTFSASLIRNLLRTADFFPFFYVVGSVSICVTQRFQRLGDLAAGTLVIYADKEQHDSSTLHDVTPIAPHQALGEEQQVAFVNFALNRGGISPDRQHEIAEIIRPRLPLNADEPRDYIRGVGKWLMGARPKGVIEEKTPSSSSNNSSQQSTTGDQR